MNSDRLEYLLDRYFDEVLTQEEQSELESLLLSWPQARTLFWKRARFHALLRRRGREIWGRRLATEQAPSRLEWPILETLRGWREMVFNSGWWAAAALAGVVLLLTISRWPGAKTADAANRFRSGENIAPRTSGQGIATILRAVGVQWPGNQRVGNVLGPGWLKFEKGLVEVQFHSGARVTIEGPAEFELITDMRARCALGKVRAEVPPPANGFEILSPNVRVVDRGTAFGFEVQRDGPAEIHVFSGRVELATSQQPDTLRELLQGNAVRVDAAGTLSDIPSGAQNFTSSETVEQRANKTMSERFSAWKAYAERLRNDPTLLVQYTFEDDLPFSRTLQNYALNASKESHGTIVGCSRTEGRWPGKHALDFKQIGDRVRLALPRRYDGLTCVTWIRLDALDHRYTALWMSGDAAIGELQWQLTGDGRLLFGKRRAAGWGGDKVWTAGSERVLGPEKCGSWMQLAFAYDATTGTVTHYVDGLPLKKNRMDPRVPLTTGALEIGNWTPAGGDPMEPIRAFNGRMDEFLVFSRALEPEKIQALWEIGRPL